jgi:hypothetical protein
MPHIRCIDRDLGRRVRQGVGLLKNLESNISEEHKRESLDPVSNDLFHGKHPLTVLDLHGYLAPYRVVHADRPRVLRPEEVLRVEKLDRQSVLF